MAELQFSSVISARHTDGVGLFAERGDVFGHSETSGHGALSVRDDSGSDVEQRRAAAIRAAQRGHRAACRAARFGRCAENGASRIEQPPSWAGSERRSARFGGQNRDAGGQY